MGPAVWHGGAVSVERVVAAGSPGAGGDDAAMMTGEGVAVGRERQSRRAGRDYRGGPGEAIEAGRET